MFDGCAPGDVQVIKCFLGHEYAKDNLEFAYHIDPDNQSIQVTTVFRPAIYTMLTAFLASLDSVQILHEKVEGVITLNAPLACA